MTLTSDGADLYRRSDRVDETRVGERVVLYHRDSGNGVVLNPTGSLIWDALQSPRSAEDLTDRLREVFPSIPLEQVSADVGSYVTALLEHDLIAAGS